MGKKEYEKPMVEVIHFETEDIITTSGGNNIVVPGGGGDYDLPFVPSSLETNI